MSTRAPLRAKPPTSSLRGGTRHRAGGATSMGGEGPLNRSGRGPVRDRGSKGAIEGSKSSSRSGASIDVSSSSRRSPSRHLHAPRSRSCARTVFTIHHPTSVTHDRATARDPHSLYQPRAHRSGRQVYKCVFDFPLCRYVCKRNCDMCVVVLVVVYTTSPSTRPCAHASSSSDSTARQTRTTAPGRGGYLHDDTRL